MTDAPTRTLLLRHQSLEAMSNSEQALDKLENLVGGI